MVLAGYDAEKVHCTLVCGEVCVCVGGGLWGVRCSRCFHSTLRNSQSTAQMQVLCDALNTNGG